MKRVTARFPEELWQEVGELAKALGISKSEYARQALTKAVERTEQRAEPFADQATRQE
ncbi:CopG family transcriptional regulator [Glycomyces sp. NPDC021274]|uniref:CopG family transcriptional regulator n=1 Tax=Glycomyces sp. NPDC021274 TaxID=3155120 RepID=UPI0033FF2AF2